MISEEKLVEDFQKTRQILEEQEDDIRRYQYQCHQLTEEAYSELHYILSSFEHVDAQESLFFARKELTRLEENYMSEINHKKKDFPLSRRNRENLYTRYVRTKNKE